MFWHKIRSALTKPADAITEREWEIIIAICVHDMSVHETAARLYVESATVWVCLSRVYNKIDVRGVDELRKWYAREYPPLGLNYRDYNDDDTEAYGEGDPDSADDW